jgi:predicted nucleic acid-binding protein
MTSHLPRGRTLLALESLIAAIAIHHGHVLVTRNVEDMKIFKSLKIHSPWT